MSDSSHRGVHFRSSFPCRGVRGKFEIDFWGDQFRGSALRSYVRANIKKALPKGARIAPRPSVVV